MSENMSAKAVSTRQTPPSELDEALKTLKENSRTFRRLSFLDKANLLQSCIGRLHEISKRWVEHGTQAKRLAPDQVAEEWLSGPLPTIRMARLLVDSLERTHREGSPGIGKKTFTNAQGRLQAEVFPTSLIDTSLFTFFSGHVVFEEGVDLTKAKELQHTLLHPSHDGQVSVVLGAGNVSSIPPMDVFSVLFIDGRVACLKMNPVNEWLGPILEHALAPLVSKGFLKIVYGGADTGKFLVEHKHCEHIHITGSDKTHDLIVWGSNASKQNERKRNNNPVLKVPITSELGNISPVVMVPGHYSKKELLFQAKNVVTMLANNASFNCNAAKLLVTSNTWKQRDAFFNLIEGFLSSMPSRFAYYPGASARYNTLTADRELRVFGSKDNGSLPWTLIKSIDPQNTSDPLFRQEPFCSILSEASFNENDPAEFLETCTGFLNHTLWGTLNAAVVAPRHLTRQTFMKNALGKIVGKLKYGTVGINHWPAVGYGLGSLPWGGHPSSTLDNIQSGLGWVHNTYLLAGIEKSILKGPSYAFPKPVWFFDNKAAHKIGPKIVDMEAKPSWQKVPKLASLALRG